ncbi:MAG: amidohydrolase family protein [Bacillus subtilis]|nr:amidohydrolase family protein [Bacillus subtilis]
MATKNFETKHQLDKSGCFLIPGLIDPHVHFDLDLGDKRSVDNFETGSAIAARGGFTTIIDFLSPASTAKELLQNYIVRCKEAEDSMIDYTFHAAIKNPQGSLEAFVDRDEGLGLGFP